VLPGEIGLVLRVGILGGARPLEARQVRRRHRRRRRLALEDAVEREQVAAVAHRRRTLGGGIVADLAAGLDVWLVWPVLPAADEHAP
jgi:hypothetical protein